MSRHQAISCRRFEELNGEGEDVSRDLRVAVPNGTGGLPLDLLWGRAQQVLDRFEPTKVGRDRQREPLFEGSPHVIQVTALCRIVDLEPLSEPAPVALSDEDLEIVDADEVRGPIGCACLKCSCPSRHDGARAGLASSSPPPHPIPAPSTT